MLSIAARTSRGLSRGVAVAGILSISTFAARNMSYSNCEPSSALTLSSVPSVQLYQYRICPFCNRVKVLLDFLQIDYEAIEVNPLSKAEIKFSKDHKKVPIAFLDGNMTIESSNIIDILVSKIVDNQAKKDFVTPDTQQWSEWSEKKLAVLLYPNITRNFTESWECFAYTQDVDAWNPVMQLVTRSAGAAAMLVANGKIKKKYNIVDERAELKSELKIWSDALGNNTFLHGDKITMPDLMVFGVLRSIQKMRTFNEIMEENDVLKRWYENVAKSIASK